jgi:hypothetical protein
MILAAIRKLRGVEYRSKSVGKVHLGAVGGKYSEPWRLSFYAAAADVWADSPWPGKHYLGTGATLPEALRHLAERIEAGEEYGEWAGRIVTRLAGGAQKGDTDDDADAPALFE